MTNLFKILEVGKMGSSTCVSLSPVSWNSLSFSLVSWTSLSISFVVSWNSRCSIAYDYSCSVAYDSSWIVLSLGILECSVAYDYSWIVAIALENNFRFLLWYISSNITLVLACSFRYITLVLPFPPWHKTTVLRNSKMV